MSNFRSRQTRTYYLCLKAAEVRSLLRYVLLILMTALGNWSTAHASSHEKSFFFATPAACAASGVFRKADCNAAFANALIELKDRAPSFSSRVDCELRFRLCEERRDGLAETSGDGAQHAYAPIALGIEIAPTDQDAVFVPILAVEAPGMFPVQPISRAYKPRESLKHEQTSSALDAAPPADRFEPFSARPAPNSSKLIETSEFADLAEVKSELSTHETVRERRMRLRNAPLVE